MNPYGTIITDAGAEAISAALLVGKKLPIAWAAEGDGNGRKTAPSRGQTALAHELWRGEIASAKKNPVTPNMIDVKFVLPDEVGGFTIRELGLNGSGRVLVVRKDCYDLRQWHSSNVNAYATCTLNAWLNGDYKELLDADIQTAMGTTKFCYTPGNGNTIKNILERTVFALSATELGGAPTAPP